MFFVTSFIIGLTSINTYIAIEDTPNKIEYLSDVFFDRVAFFRQGWGKLGVDTATYAPDKTPLPLKIKNRIYEKGIGTHAPSEIIVELDGEYEAFEAEIGIQKQNGDNVGSVIFQIFVDGVKRYDSGVIKELDTAKPIRIFLSNAKEMRLIVIDAGDGITCDCANWANAKLIKSSFTEVKPPVEPLDIAQFAQVITCDTNRNEGCRCNRIEEFPEEDIFLENEILPNSENIYIVPTDEDGTGCIGLKWYERRHIKSLMLCFSDESYIPNIDEVQIQGWSGESQWQGMWKSLDCSIQRQDKKFIFNLEQENYINSFETEKIRWLLSKSSEPIKISKISAFTNSRWNISDFYIELEHPINNKYGETEIYNGLIVESNQSVTKELWDLSSPKHLKILHNKSKFSKSDRTLIYIHLPSDSYGIAIDDVIANGCVYIPDKIFITSKPAKYSLFEYRKTIAGRKTVLKKVRNMPDQTFEQAMEKVHRKIQDNGPTMISLACDNNKFIVDRNGTVRYGYFELQTCFGSGKNELIKRRLYGGWLPAPIISANENGIVYEQCAYVVPFDKADTRLWLNNRPLCVVEFILKNESMHEMDVYLRLNFFSNVENKEIAKLNQVNNGFIIHNDSNKILACVNNSHANDLKAEINEGMLTLSGKLPGHAHRNCFVYIPAWNISDEECKLLAGSQDLKSDLENYWSKILNSAIQIDIPDKFLLNVIKASQVHCLIAARNISDGKLIQPWIASMAYGPLESESHSIIRGMYFMGHNDFAERSLDFFISSYNPAGFLTTGYTLMGTGWHLWTLGEFYQLTQNSKWLKRNAQAIMKSCLWITKQLVKTKKLNSRGEKYPEYGLMPPGVVADWNRFAYRTFMEGHYFAGLHEAGKALSDIDYPNANLLQKEALEFRDNILRAYEWTQERSPVLPLSDGTWVKPYPGMIYCFGLVGDIFPEEDWNRTWAGDVEIGSHHLIPLGIIDPHSKDAEYITEHMEDFWFLRSGMGEYTNEENEKDWFNLGGFAKVQPYYGRINEIYAMRDDVKPFIRSYFNAIPSLLNTENLSFWEHFHNMGAWNKTHETGAFLQQTRFMFIFEKDDKLWLAPFITNNWMKDSMNVSIKNAPTRFGKVSYRVTSHIKDGYIEAAIEPPKCKQPKELILRLRHPNNKPIKNVILNGLPYNNFDKQAECIYIEPSNGIIKIRAEY